MAKPRVHFEAAFDGLREDFSDVGQNLVEIIDLAVRCYFLQSPTLSSHVYSLSAEINCSLRGIDAILLQSLSSKQLNPAIMRHLMACIKVNVLLAEVCALVVSTADVSLSFDCSRIDWPDNITKLGIAVCTQLRTAIQALSDADDRLAAGVIDGSETIALLGNDAWIHLVESMKSTPSTIDNALSALMTVRNFEKIAGHAISIAECVLLSAHGT